MKRRQIIRNLRNLQRDYSINEKTRTCLDKLVFKSVKSTPLWWELFTREGNNAKEFVAIYNEGKYIVTGNSSDLEIPRNDLRVIAEFFQRGNAVRFAENDGLMMLPWFSTLGLLDLLNSKGLTIGGLAFGIGSSLLTRRIVNRYYGSKLSFESENYLYDADAERDLFRKIPD